MILIYHLIAFGTGFVLDLILGDPHFIYHPIRLIGNLISLCERKLNKDIYSDRKRRRNGFFLVLIVLTCTFVVVAMIIVGAYLINPYAGIVAESIMTYQILATKSLKVESMKVYYALAKGDLEEARKAVSMIVGRDTVELSEEGVAKAAI